MTHGLHHYHKRKNKKQTSQRKKAINLMDSLIYIGAVVVPLAYLPQLIKIWVEKTAAGVSIISWFAFLAGAIFWLTYGFLHKAKPIIIMYTIMLILETFIVVGILLYR